MDKTLAKMKGSALRDKRWARTVRAMPQNAPLPKASIRLLNTRSLAG
jgi:hypothetical protein